MAFRVYLDVNTEYLTLGAITLLIIAETPVRPLSSHK